MAAEVPLRRNRDFVLLWSGQAASVLGSHVAATAYPLLVLALTGSPAAAGVVGFVAALPHVLFQLPAGALVDRWDRKRLLVASDVVGVVALATLVAALVLGHAALAHVAVVAFVEGTLSVVVGVAQTAAVRQVVPRPQLAAALSRNEARERAAALLGRPLGGVLFGIGRAVPFLADALSHVVSLAAVLLVRTDLRAPAREAPRPLASEVAEGIGWLWRRPFLRAATILVAGSNFLFSALFLALIVIARERGASPAVVGLVLAGFGIGGVLGALAAPWLAGRVAMKPLVLGANWLWAALVPLVAVAPGPAALAAVAAAMAFVGPAWNVVIGAYVLAIVPDRLVGRVSSAESLVAFGAIPLGSLAGGILLESLGSVGATLALAGWMLAIAIAATASPSIRRAPTLREARLAASGEPL